MVILDQVTLAVRAVLTVVIAVIFFVFGFSLLFVIASVLTKIL